MELKYTGYDRYIPWRRALPKEESCYVRVKYKPKYYDGKEEDLQWIPECKVAGFWRREGDTVSLVWWMWIESFSIIESETQPR